MNQEENEKTKICPRKSCIHRQKEQTIDNFTKDRSKKDGFCTVCKECRHVECLRDREKTKNYDRERQQNNKEKFRIIRKEHYNQHKVEILKYQKERYEKSIQLSENRYFRLKNGPKTIAATFNLSLEHFIDLTSQKCTYCDQYSPGKEYVGIDQLIPGQGYTLGNSISCCSVCNRMKLDHSVADFLSHVFVINNFQEIKK